MNIIQTLNSSMDICTLQKELQFLNERNIKGIRINLCKFVLDELDQVFNNISYASSVHSQRFELIFDLPYPKNKARIRDYNMVDNLVRKGKIYVIAKNDMEINLNGNVIKVDVDEFSSNIEEGTVIYFGDGEGAFKIIEKCQSYLVTEAVNNFTIFRNKGISCGYVSCQKEYLKIFDKMEQIFNGTVTVLLSFLQTKEELDYLKSNCNLGNIQLISKIELVEDINNIPNVVKNSDGVLLARGDMGLLNNMCDLLDICKVVSEQTQLSKKRLLAATDIMSSMENREFPSRADMFDLCMLHSMGCTDIVLAYHISPKLDNIIEMIENFDN